MWIGLIANIYIYIYIYVLMYVYMWFADGLMKNELNLTILQLFGTLVSNLPCFY